MIIGQKDYNPLAVMGRLATRYKEFPLTYLSEIMEKYYKTLDALKNRFNKVDEITK